MIDRWLETLQPRTRRIAVLAMLAVMVTCLVAAMQCVILAANGTPLWPAAATKTIATLAVMLAVMTTFVLCKRLANGRANTDAVR